MGRSGSSSRRKRSKKKSSKVSSEGYRKKKSRRNKSKKLHRQDDSFSSSSDDESTSSSLNSYSCSEGEYKRKRARSRSRSEIKGSKKRRRRRSLSEDSGEDSSPVKRRKRSKKSKKIKKKKSRRDAYVSSASSDSGSCSTCKYEDSSSDELGSHGRSRGRSREKKKDHRYSTKGRIENRKNRSKSRSSFSPSSNYGGESVEKVTLEYNPMRLKSVITVANLEHEEEEDNMKNNEVKEEMVYDYDDYPSSKSNDSIEAVDRFNMSSPKKDVVKEVNSGSSLDDNKEKESNVSGNIGSESDNLESILRQKALENLSRFRGGIKTKPEVAVDEKPRSDQTGVKQLKHETVSTIPASQPVINRSRFTWRRDPSVTTAKDEKAATYSEQHPSGSQPAEPKLQSANASSTSRVDNKFVNETSKIMANTNKVDQNSTAVDETPSSSSIKEGSSKEQQNESNDNSQFEKKTMSVMRGGEMVQVSYKVYIPNRAPALARRQLKR